MLTRCPHCQTTFRVTADQLKPRQGRVRCGACQRVFDALESLVDEPAMVVGPVEPAPPEPAPPEPAPPEPAPPEPVPPEPQPPEPAISEPTPDVVDDLPPEWQTVSPPPPPRRWPWVFGSLLLGFTAVGQLLYLYRTDLALAMPAWRPTLVAVCDRIGCDLPLPRQPQLLGIESSDLQPAAGARLRLVAILKNRAPFAQAYPHLELTLTDTNDAPLVRRVLAPEDWLPADRVAAAGFPAHGALALERLVEVGDVAPVGYRLYLFYP